MLSTPQVIAEVSAGIRSGDLSSIHHELLSLDLRRGGYGILPEDILSRKTGCIQGPIIVQVSDVIDVSRPSYLASKSRDGVLFCSLHDGRICGNAVVLDTQSCPLSTNTTPGSKVVLTDARIEEGLIVLDAARMQVCN